MVRIATLSSPLNMGTPSGVNLCRSCEYCHRLCEFIWASAWLWLEHAVSLETSISSGFYNLQTLACNCSSRKAMKHLASWNTVDALRYGTGGIPPNGNWLIVYESCSYMTACAMQGSPATPRPWSHKVCDPPEQSRTPHDSLAFRKEHVIYVENKFKR